MNEAEAKRILKVGNLADAIRAFGICPQFHKQQAQKLFPRAFQWYEREKLKKRKRFLKNIWRIFIRKEETGEPYYLLEDIFGISSKTRSRYFKKYGLKNTRTSGGKFIVGCPCVGCENFSLCRTEKVACQQFRSFVESRGFKRSMPNNPNREIFLELFPREGQDGRAKGHNNQDQHPVFQPDVASG